MPRIAIAGFQHETNTFAAVKAGIDEFEMADAWPGLLAGASVMSGTKGLNLPIAEAIISSAAPGMFPCRLDPAPCQGLRNGMRLGPTGRPFALKSA